MNDCILFNQRKQKCDPLKETDCKNCKFYLTEEMKMKKEVKVQQWYRKNRDK